MSNTEPVLFDENLNKLLPGWVKDCNDCNKELNLFVGVDTGGTNTRVAIGNGDIFKVVAHFKCDSTRVLVQCLSSLSEKINLIIDCKKYIKAGCIDVAGRVSNLGKYVEITNYRSDDNNIHRELSLDELPELLFPKGHSRMINDLESACYGISALNSRNQVNDYFKILLGPKDEENNNLSFEHYLVIAVGTGMGVGLLMALPGQNNFVVLPLEGGHILLNSSPFNHVKKKEEEEMLNYISNSLYEGNHSLEYEDLVSGRGLEALYNFFVHNVENENIPKNLTAAQISENAQNGEEYSSKALLYHYLYLSRASSNLSICLGAKGIFWAGGNQISNGKFVEDNRCELLF